MQLTAERKSKKQNQCGKNRLWLPLEISQKQGFDNSLHEDILYFAKVASVFFFFFRLECFLVPVKRKCLSWCLYCPLSSRLNGVPLRRVRWGGGGGVEVSCPSVFSIACPKIKWFCPNITYFHALKLILWKIRGGGGRGSSTPSPIPRTPCTYKILYINLNFLGKLLTNTPYLGRFKCLKHPLSGFSRENFHETNDPKIPPLPKKNWETHAAPCAIQWGGGGGGLFRDGFKWTFMTAA